MDDAGLPPGVLNVVTTTSSKDIGAALMADDRLRKVSFTGSTEVGKVLVRQSADELQRVSMELGGNAPFLVFDDADVDAAVDGAMIAKMRNMGEACTSANRFLVHESVAQEFADKLGARMSGADGRPGPGRRRRRRAPDQRRRGPVRQRAGDRCRARRGHAGHRRQGSRRPGLVLPADRAGRRTRGRADQQRRDLRPGRADHHLLRRRTEAVERANSTEYGLVSYAYTKDLDRTIRLAESLDFGMVGINTGLVSNPAAPFGGVKASGFGREGGFEGMDEYLDTTYVAIPAG